MAKKKGLTVGIFTALHTFGRDLKWNTHVHLSVTLGGLTRTNQWRSISFNEYNAMKMWRYAIVDLLRQSYHQLILLSELQLDCSSKPGFNQWLDTHYQKHWIVYFSKPSKNHRHNISYLGRYVKRPPVSMPHLVHYDGRQVIFRYLDHNDNQYKDAIYDAETFIERFIQHIPDKHFRLINYYGFLANRVRSKLLLIIYDLLDQPEKGVYQFRFAQLLKSSFGLDPLQCILCGSPLAFVGLHIGKPFYKLYGDHKKLALAKPIF